ncbi:hypothetical protein EPN44_16135 [bacterium]|nr:MAG: hypothetical protein EPN44_16135 [bacterium]
MLMTCLHIVRAPRRRGGHAQPGRSGRIGASGQICQLVRQLVFLRPRRARAGRAATFAQILLARLLGRGVGGVGDAEHDLAQVAVTGQRQREAVGLLQHLLDAGDPCRHRRRTSHAGAFVTADGALGDQGGQLLQQLGGSRQAQRRLGRLEKAQIGHGRACQRRLHVAQHGTEPLGVGLDQAGLPGEIGAAAGTGKTNHASPPSDSF